MTENPDAIVAGLAQTVARLVTILVEQGAIKSAPTIQGFEQFRSHMGQSDHDQAAALWTDHILHVLRADPNRPPPADILPFSPPTNR